VPGFNGGQELTPRVLVTAVPYALRSAGVGDEAGNVHIANRLLWGDGSQLLDESEYSGIRLGSSTNPTNRPLVDFHYHVGMEQDYNTRLINNADGVLSFWGVPVNQESLGRNYSLIQFSSDQGGSLKLGNPINEGGGPYIDFRLGVQFEQDYNVRLVNESSGVLAFYGPPDARFDVHGRLRANVLQITGGSDLAEPFDVTAPAAHTPIVPGMVMVIDRERDGKLTPCARAYDTAVAGVLSGAKGLQPGMVMKAEGQPHAEGEHPLAMTGRVWCLADAAHGAIQRGDRLTTSPTVGHAMKALDPARADGAVIGKAMSELESGTGLVLVLVNLQ
jgi:hypothetical protein